MKALMVSLVAAGALALGGLASAGTMTPVFGAHLSGMGEHGFVNFHSYATKHRLCFTFSLKTKGITAASLRDAHGMVVARLGGSYHAKGCAMVSRHALELIEGHLSRYSVWVDTKGHPGDLRGKLVRGMVHM